MIPPEALPPIFWEIHKGLPRQGPGDDAHTRRAFHAVGTLPADPVVVDVGCGPGMQTLELARLVEAPVIAFDTHEPFLRELRQRATAEGLADMIDARVGDMNDLPLDSGSVDLLWSEGAIYLIGFEQGLTTWRPLLSPTGAVAVTEATWLKRGAPDELRRFWNDAYPAMTDREENVRTVERCGYRLVQQFTLPADAWWTHYYDPLVARMSALRARHADDPEALAGLDEEALEIELFRRYHDYYGYVFYVMRRDDERRRRAAQGKNQLIDT